MHVLLPPSEAKTSVGRGSSIRKRTAAEHGAGEDPLRTARKAAIDALLHLLDGDRQIAARALALPHGVADAALRVNAVVLDAPTTPALRRYSGIVYEGLAFGSMTVAEQRIAARSTLVFSGLWGVLRGDEPIPEYRVPAKAQLPGLGIASTYWRPVLAAVLPALVRKGLVIDMRSSDYAAMWRPDRDLAHRVVGVRVLSPAPRGGHAVISHTSKLAKGRLAAALVRRAGAGTPVETPDDVATAWADCGGVACETTPAAPGRPARLDLYTA